MKLEKAAILLYKYRHIDDDLCVEDVNEALELGIEALKHIKRDRELPHNPDHPLLPGETEE